MIMPIDNRALQEQNKDSFIDKVKQDPTKTIVGEPMTGDDSVKMVLEIQEYINKENK